MVSEDVSKTSGLKTVFFLSAVDSDGVFALLVHAMLTRGHEVTVASHRPAADVPDAKAPLFTDLRGRYPEFFDYAELQRRRDPWRIPAGSIRRSLDYLYHLDPESAGGDSEASFDDQAGETPPRALRPLLFIPPFRSSGGRRFLSRFLRRLEAGLPRPRALRSFIEEQAAEVVVVSPLAEFSSAQAELVRTADRTGTPSVMVLSGADDLMSKGIVNDVPTLTVVSKKEQIDDLVLAHGLTRERTVAVGVPSFDGLDGPAIPAVVDEVERAATIEVVPSRRGRILRPFLWLLTPLLMVLLVVLRPRVTARALARGARRTVNRIRRLATRARRRVQRFRRRIQRRRVMRAKAKLRAEKKERAAARTAKVEEKARVRAAKEANQREKAERALRR